MSLEISSPNDAVENRKTSVLMTWVTETPGQVAYEFQYKPSTSTAWSTLGKVNWTSQSAYINLSSLTDGMLYHYRLAVYFEHRDSIGVDYKITELSPAYSLVLTTNRLGILKIKTGLLTTDVEQTPLYDEANKTGPKIKVKIEDTVVALGSFNNDGEITDFQSDFKVKIKTDESAKRTIREYGNFYYTTIESQAYRADRYRYLYFIPEKWDYAYDHTYLYYEDRSYSYHNGYRTYVSGGYNESYASGTGSGSAPYTYYKKESYVTGTFQYYTIEAGYPNGPHTGTNYAYHWVPVSGTYNYSYTTYSYRWVDTYSSAKTYSYHWYLYMYYEYYYNVYQDHYNYGYDYTGYTYDRRYIYTYSRQESYGRPVVPARYIVYYSPTYSIRQLYYTIYYNTYGTAYGYLTD